MAPLTSEQPRCSVCLAVPGLRGHCVYHPGAPLASMPEEDALSQRRLLQRSTRVQNRVLAVIFVACAVVFVSTSSEDMQDVTRHTGSLLLAEFLFIVPAWAWRRSAVLRGHPISQAPLWSLASLSVIGWLCLMASVAMFHNNVRELENPQLIFSAWLAFPGLLWITSLGTWAWSSLKHRT